MTKVSDEQTYFDLEYVFHNLRTGIENMKILTHYGTETIIARVAVFTLQSW